VKYVKEHRYTRTDEWTWWYENGKVKEKGSYNNGNLTGEWTYWDENGTLL
jgi:antitoxin component YwqK of YwqJK toxin-antitoxin module